MGLRYLACDPLGRTQLAPPLRLNTVKWTENVNGNGQFTANLTLPEDTDVIARLKTAVSVGKAIYAMDTDSSTFPWGGYIIGRDWDPDAGVIGITAVEWRSWLYGVFLGPNTDLSGDIAYDWTGIDQLQIAKEIVAQVTSAGITDGRPTIATGEEVSGKTRDLNIKGMDFKNAGALIDSMAQRSGGFEWTVEVEAGPDGLPSLRLGLYYPQRGSLIPGLVLRHTPDGANFQLSDKIQASIASRQTRCWATGSTESAQYAMDSDPALSSAGTLLCEGVRNYSSVSDRTTLASHARAEREYLSPEVNTLQGWVHENLLPVTSYRAGDRTRLVYLDAMYDLDLPAVRVISRSVEPLSGAGKVGITLDLDDSEEPETDSGGAV